MDGAYNTENIKAHQVSVGAAVDSLIRNAENIKIVYSALCSQHEKICRERIDYIDSIVALLNSKSIPGNVTVYPDGPEKPSKVIPLQECSLNHIENYVKTCYDKLSYYEEQAMRTLLNIISNRDNEIVSLYDTLLQMEKELSKMSLPEDDLDQEVLISLSNDTATLDSTETKEEHEDLEEVVDIHVAPITLVNELDNLIKPDLEPTIYPEDEIYKIPYGMSLRKLSEEFYGDDSHWLYIYYNGGNAQKIAARAHESNISLGDNLERISSDPFALEGLEIVLPGKYRIKSPNEEERTLI